MSRRDRLGEMADLGVSAGTRRDLTAASTAAAFIPGVGVPLAAAIQIAPELLHPQTLFRNIKHDIFSLFGHASTDAQANLNQAIYQHGIVAGWGQVLNNLRRPVLNSRDPQAVALWNAAMAEIARYPTAMKDDWKLFGSSVKRIEKKVVGVMTRLNRMGVLAQPESGRSWGAMMHVLLRYALPAFRKVQRDYPRPKGPSQAATVHLMSDVVRRIAAAGDVRVARSRGTASRVEANPDAARLRAEAAAAIKTTQALAEKARASSSPGVQTAYRHAYQEAQRLVAQTQQAQRIAVPVSAPEQIRVAQEPKKAGISAGGWLAIGASALALLMRAI